MWAIYEKRQIKKILKKAPIEVLKKYEAWKRIVEISGPSGLLMIKGFRDEALKGKWNGYRSSRFGIKWRIIYKVENDVLEVHIFEITPHKY